MQQSLPAIGDTVHVTKNADSATVYARKHVPWISFTNAQINSDGNTINQRFADFPTDAAGFENLPKVSIVIPDLLHDMHNWQPPYPIRRGDDWLKDNLDAYAQWAKTHNSLFIVLFYENNDGKDIGLTFPSLMIPYSTRASIDRQNRTVTIFVGDHVKEGFVAETPIRRSVWRRKGDEVQVKSI